MIQVGTQDVTKTIQQMRPLAVNLFRLAAEVGSLRPSPDAKFMFMTGNAPRGADRASV